MHQPYGQKAMQFPPAFQSSFLWESDTYHTFCLKSILMLKMVHNILQCWITSTVESLVYHTIQAKHPLQNIPAAKYGQYIDHRRKSDWFTCIIKSNLILCKCILYVSASLCNKWRTSTNRYEGLMYYHPFIYKW